MWFRAWKDILHKTLLLMSINRGCHFVMYMYVNRSVSNRHSKNSSKHKTPSVDVCNSNAPNSKTYFTISRPKCVGAGDSFGFTGKELEKKDRL